MNEVFTQSLSVMFWGMAGIFIVLTIIYCAIKGLMKLFPAK